LKNRDADAARQLIAADSEINGKRFAIESETLVLIARQQPMATDLRVLAAVLEIATELERIADYAKGIAKLAIQLKDQPYTKPLIDIPKMAEKAADMLHGALNRFYGAAMSNWPAPSPPKTAWSTDSTSKSTAS